MPRPKKCRRIRFSPECIYFKPRGIPMKFLEEIVLSMDEVEAIRLKDKEGLEQTDCAKRMKISQSTFQRLITSAHQKIALAIIDSKAIRIIKNNIGPCAKSAR